MFAVIHVVLKAIVIFLFSSSIYCTRSVHVYVLSLTVTLMTLVSWFALGSISAAHSRPAHPA